METSRSSLADGILRKLLRDTDSDTGWATYIDHERGIYDVRASLTDEEIAYLETL
jgi:hypothetical protein